MTFVKKIYWQYILAIYIYMKLIYYDVNKNTIMEILKNKVITPYNYKKLKYTKLNLKHIGEYKMDYDDSYHFEFDSKLLLENEFILNLDYCALNYKAQLKKKYQNGRTLREYELKEKLKKFHENSIKYMNYRKKHELFWFFNIYTDEILVKENISLEKYLKGVYIPKYNKKIVDYCKKYYPQVTVKYKKSK